MAEQADLEQEISVLEQDDLLLRKTLTTLQQSLDKATDRLSIQHKIEETEAELKALAKTLEALKARAGLNEAENQTPAPLFNVPELPEPLLVHSDMLSELKAKLVVKAGLAEASANQKNPILIQANSGMGKSTLAAILARDSSVRRTFVDGLFWLSFGPDPDIVQLQIDVLKILRGEAYNFTDAEEGHKVLKEACQKRACLFILDDFWDVRDALMFSGLGAACQLIMTTCDNTQLGYIKHFVSSTQGYTLRTFGNQEAVNYCTRLLDKTVDNASVTRIVECSQGIPASLRVNVNLMQQMQNADRVADALNDIDCAEFEETYHPCVLMQAMRVHIDLLGDTSEYYIALSVFADYTRIPQNAIAHLWQYLYQMSRDQTNTFLNKLAARGLLNIKSSTTGNVISLQVHQYDYLCIDADLDKLHEHILATYRRLCGQHGWANGPDDGYFFPNLAFHLQAAERTRELRSLLLDFDWLEAKLRKAGLHALLNDYEYFEEDQDLDVVQQALQQSANLLVKDQKQLAQTLLEKLHTRPSKDIQKMLNQAKEHAPKWQTKNT